MDFDRHFNLFRRHVDSLFDDFDSSFYRIDPYFVPMKDETMTSNNNVSSNDNNNPYNKEIGESNTTICTRDNTAGTPSDNTAGTPRGRNNSNSLSLFNNRSFVVPRMKIDVIEEPNAYVVNAELPGLTKDDVRLTVDNDVLTISAERKNVVNEEDKNKHYILMERSYGAVSRSLRLPPGSDTSKISARHEHGILTVSVPRNPAHNTQKTIRIE
jgi:HSP20 family protein